MGVVNRTQKSITLSALVSLALAGCSGGEDAGTQEVQNLSNDTSFAYVAKSVAVESQAMVASGNQSLQNKTSAPISANSPYELAYGAQFTIQSSLDIDAQQYRNVVRDFFGSDNYGVKDLSTSPDGRTLIFAAHGPQGHEYNVWSIFTLDFATMTMRPVIADPDIANAGYDTNPVFTLDGNILFSSDRSAGNPNSPVTNTLDPELDENCFKIEPTEKPSLLHTMERDGSNILQITYGNNHDLMPVILADGRAAFLRASQRYRPAQQCAFDQEKAGSDSEQAFRVEGAINLNRPEAWDDNALCRFAIDTIAGPVIAENQYTILRITTDGEEIEQLYDTTVLGGADDTFVTISQLSQAENGKLIAILKHQFNEFLGGVPVELQSPFEQRTDTVFGEFSPRPLVSNDVNVYPSNISVGGWTSALDTYRDGSGRTLMSWSRCTTLNDSNVSAFCSDASNPDRVDNQFGLWVMDMAEDRLPVTQSQRDVVYTELAISQAHNNAAFPYDAFNPDYEDNLDSARVVCLPPEATPTPTPAPTRTPAPTPVVTPSPVVSPTPIVSPTPTPIVIPPTPVVTPVPTRTPVVTPTSVPTPTPVVTPTSRPTPTPVVTPTSRPTPTPVVTPTSRPTPTPVVTPTSRPTPTPVVTPTSVPTPTPVVTPTSVPTPTPVVTPTLRPTPTPVITPTPAVTPTPIASPTPVATPTPPPEPTNRAPVAVVSESIRTTVGALNTLDGSDSFDPDGDELTYQWTSSSDALTLTMADQPMPVAVATERGTFTVTLVVNDGEISSEPASLRIAVLNTPPVADAGEDIETTAGAEPMDLDGSNSGDADGDEITYLWSLVNPADADKVMLTDVTEPVAKVSLNEQGSFTIQLVVNDGTADSEPDMVLVSAGNAAPVANAGADVEYETDDVVMLDGTGSFDPEGADLSYSWRFISVPNGANVELDDASSESPIFTPNQAGSYVVELVVNDGDLDSAPDTVSIEVVNPPVICEYEDPSKRTFPTIIRDFKDSHPDFEYRIVSDEGIVERNLGADGLPVYANPEGTTPSTNGKATFDQWYRDVEDVNIPIPVELPLDRVFYDDRWIWEYRNFDFFPINNQGWGNEGRVNNYHFTLEAHLVFDYKGGEHFLFAGDDDLFVFINGKLAIDIGGVHPIEVREISLDDIADELGIEIGNRYTFDLFFAERHTEKSTFKFQTSIDLECIEP